MQLKSDWEIIWIVAEKNEDFKSKNARGAEKNTLGNNKIRRGIALFYSPTTEFGSFWRNLMHPLRLSPKDCYLMQKSTNLKTKNLQKSRIYRK